MLVVARKLTISLRRRLQCLAASCAMLALIGCITPQNTRFPSFFRPHPVAERASYERSDPLFDPAIGPSLDARPRDFIAPRTIERRAAQNRLLQGMPSEPETLPPFSTGLSYSGAIN